MESRERVPQEFWGKLVAPLSVIAESAVLSFHQAPEKRQLSKVVLNNLGGTFRRPYNGKYKPFCARHIIITEKTRTKTIAH